MAMMKPDHGYGTEKQEETVEITLRTIGPSPPSRLMVPSPIKVHDLRKLVAGTSHFPIEDTRLIFRGNVLLDQKNGDALTVQFHDGENLIVAVKPKPPTKHILDDADEDDGEELKFELPQSTGRWKRRLFFFLRDRFKIPDLLLMALFSPSLKLWAIIISWFILLPVSQRLDVGPLYILITGFAIIFYNLGHRQPGDVSAYSIFNEDFRELPGTLNADRLDRDIRAGQF